MPGLAEHLLDQVDADLEAVPALPELTSRQLIALLHRSRTVLRALHAHEILMGMLTDTGGNRHDRRVGGAAGAGRGPPGRADRRGDPRAQPHRAGPGPAPGGPRAGAAPRGEHRVGAASARDGDSGNDNGILREALRLRVRWIQELSGRAAWALGVRLTATAATSTEPGLIRHMNLEHLEAVATKRAVVVPHLVSTHEHTFGAPLPAWFQLSDLGKPDPRRRPAPRSAAAPAPAAVGPSARSPTTPTTRRPARSS